MQVPMETKLAALGTLISQTLRSESSSRRFFEGAPETNQGGKGCEARSPLYPTPLLEGGSGKLLSEGYPLRHPYLLSHPSYLLPSSVAVVTQGYCIPC